MLEQHAFALASPPPDKGPAKVQHALFTLFLKGSFGYIASRPFFPERGDVLSQPLCKIPPSPLY
jgi:hypothetical protein